MRVFFIGTVIFSEEILKHILTLKHVEIVGIATKEISTFNNDFRDLSPIAIQNNIPFQYVKNINDEEVLEWIKSLNPDIIFCFGWSNLIKEKLLNLTPKGVIGYHPAKLPLNRGRHPIIWALVLGLKETASTFFKMDEGADTGDILSQEVIQISDTDDSLSIYNKLLEVSKMQVSDFVIELSENNVNWIVQDKNEGNNWRKRSRKDGLIDFRMTSQSIFNLVRALNKPYPGAEIFYNEKLYQVWKVKPIYMNDYENIEPGKVLSSTNHSIIVKTGDSAIEIIDHAFDQLPQVGEYI